MPQSLPFFKNYPVDWITSEKVACMMLHEVGAYKLLTDHQWIGTHCTLPDDPVRLKAMIRWDETIHGDFSRVLACFPRLRSPKGRRGNLRLLEVYAEAMARQELAVVSGQRGAAKRWAEKPKKTLTHALNGRDYRSDSKLVLAFLNEKTGKQFREVDTNLSFIEARLKSGVDVQQCKTIIARKVRDWKTDPKMAPFLRPETLFNKTKFETYLAEVT